MPRQRSAPRAAPSRPTAPSRAPAPPRAQQQTRPATTSAAPPATQQAPPPAAGASQGPGLFGQMASTAAGVAIGSSVGHAIGGFFGGGGSAEAPANPQDAAAAEAHQSNYYANQQQDPNCAMATKSFTNCMDEHQGNMSICGWYMDQLKACQTAASKY